MAEPIEVNDSTFQAEVLQSSIPVVVDFWAVWCGPCRAIAPIIHSVAEEMDDKAKICKIDVDNSPDISSDYGIRSIPTIVFFKDGKEVDRIVGITDKESITSIIRELQ